MAPEIDEWLRNRYSPKREQARLRDPEVTAWGLKNAMGASVSRSGRICVYLRAARCAARFERLLNEIFPTCPINVAVTGKFIATKRVGSGDEVSLRTSGGSGYIALLFEDSANQKYALTCNHVLDPLPAGGGKIYSGNTEIGGFFARVEMRYGMRAVPNEVDCALVRLSCHTREALLWNGGRLGQLASVVEGDHVTIVNKTKEVQGTVESIAADLTITYRNRGGHLNRSNEARFTGLIAIRPETGIIERGDSGSLVLGNGNCPIGMIIGAPEVGQVAVACDMRKIKEQLEETIRAEHGAAFELSFCCN